ncbi:MAG: hypothetical protein J4N33_01820 [Chloroflexi bacterium]|nr:hypothetical protein [Chloroflexota bacterium]
MAPIISNMPSHRFLKSRLARELKVCRQALRLVGELTAPADVLSVSAPERPLSNVSDEDLEV